MARFRSRLPRCPADAGLIRSAARPPYGELPGYARTRVSRRAAYSGPPNKTLDRPSLRLLKNLRFFAGSCPRSAHRWAITEQQNKKRKRRQDEEIISYPDGCDAVQLRKYK